MTRFLPTKRPMTIMKTTIRTYLCLGLLAVPGFAQEQKPTSPAFEKALAVEELEHDLKGAIKLYEELVHAKNTAKEIKQRTFLRLGLAYRQLGQEDQAQAALRKAAEGAGELAMLAKKAMQKPAGVSKDQAELRKQAEAALKRARQSIPLPTNEQNLQLSEPYHEWTGCWSPAGEDLVWLGSAAVPSIRKELANWLAISSPPTNYHTLGGGGGKGLGRSLDSSKLVRDGYRAFLCSVLWENGSPEARGYLKELFSRSDLNSQMAVAQGLLECGSLNPEMLALYVEVVGTSNTSIASIRAANKAAAMKNARRSAPILTQLSAEQFLNLVDTVPQAVAVDLWRHLDRLRYPIRGLEAKHLDLAGSIRSMLNSPHPGLNQGGYKVLAEYGLQSVSLRLLTLQFVDRLPDDFRLRSSRLRHMAMGGKLALGAEEMTQYSKVIAAVGQAPNGKGTGTSKHKLIESFEGIYYQYGDSSVLPVVVELVKFGYRDKADAYQWLDSKGSPVDLPMVTKAMETNPIFDYSLGWIQKQTLNKEHIPGIVAALGRLHKEGVQGRLKDVDGNRYSGPAWKSWFYGLESLTKIDDPSALAYLVNLAGSGEPATAGERLLEMSRDGIMGELRSELRITLSAQVSGEPSRHELITRSKILARLIELGDVETMIDTVGWSGLQFIRPDELQSGMVARRRRGTRREGQFAFDWLVSEVKAERKDIVSFHGYNPKQLAMIWRHHFEHPGSFPGLNPYAYLNEALRMRSSRSGRFEGVVVPATEAWVRRLKAGDFPKDGESSGLQELQEYCLGADRENEPMNPMGVELISLSLRSGNAEAAYGAVRALYMPGDARWEKDIRSWLTNSEVGGSALHCMGVLGLTLSNDEFRAIATMEERRVLEGLLKDMSRLAPDVPVDLITPLLSDSEPDIRSQTCVVLAQRLDAEAVPALLKVLGDGDENVRTAAKDALQQIRFFHDEKARWQRFFQGQEVSTVGAAQMLLAQASKDQPLVTRVLAIQSLGTLAAPETLPFLIEWAAQGPPEVVSAAKSAIERINLAASSAVDVK